jgi:hypothetical protein
LLLYYCSLTKGRTACLTGLIAVIFLDDQSQLCLTGQRTPKVAVSELVRLRLR